MSVACMAMGQHGRLSGASSHHAYGASVRDNSAGHRMASSIGRSVITGSVTSPAGSRPPSDNAQVRPQGGIGSGQPFGRDDYVADGGVGSRRNHEAAEAVLRSMHPEGPIFPQGTSASSRNPQEDERRYTPLSGSRPLAASVPTVGGTLRRRSGGEGGSQPLGAGWHPPLGQAPATSAIAEEPLPPTQRSASGVLGSSERRRSSGDEAAKTVAGEEGRRRQVPSASHPSSLASLLNLPPTPRQPAVSQALPALGEVARRAAVDDGRVAVLACVAAEANACFRAHMEDEAVVIDPFNVEEGNCDAEQWGFFAVYDGHGGRQAVEYTESKLHEILLCELRAMRPCASKTTDCGMGRWSDEVVSDALTKTFQKIDDQLRLVGAWRCGCTATVVLIRKMQNASRMYIANVGDSRAVAVDCMHTEWRVSVDHRPNDPSEIRRIEGEGGFVSRGRVAGQLGVSRALGDHALKGSGVSWRPYTCARDSTQDIALIIASDGLWDAMSDAQAREVTDRCLADQIPEQAAQLLVNAAQKAGSTDNITCLVVFFDVALMA